MAHALASAAHHLVPNALRNSSHDDHGTANNDSNNDGSNNDDPDSRTDSKHSFQAPRQGDSQPDHHFEDHPTHHAPADQQRYSQQQRARQATPQHEKAHHLPWKKTEAEKDREKEKHRIAQMADDFRSIGAMEVEDIMKDPQDKIVGHSSRTLRCSDFDLVKTLGTGESSAL